MLFGFRFFFQKWAIAARVLGTRIGFWFAENAELSAIICGMEKLQHEQVVAVVKKLGGIATLSKLYQEVDTRCWKTRTPDATIRRIVQYDKRLAKIKAGLYCMAEKFAVYSKQYDENSSSVESHNLNHHFYQGLLLQIGKARECEVYVPRNDRGRISRQIGRADDFCELPKFGYPEIVKHARTIDVIWFNGRKMPDVFCEVEISTSMHRSLEKFHELQDFHAEMWIVAPKARREYFEKRMSMEMNKPISGRVKFQSTDKIQAAYEKARISRFM